MDRETIISIVHKLCSNSLTHNDIVAVIMSYCTDKGYTESEINQALQLILLRNIISQPLFTALNYYYKKFNICTITNKEGKLITAF